VECKTTADDTDFYSAIRDSQFAIRKFLAICYRGRY